MLRIIQTSVALASAKWLWLLEIDLGAGRGGPALGYTLWRETLYGPPPDILL
jgi:hypothetical protein